MPEITQIMESTEAITAILEKFRKIRSPLSVTTPHTEEFFTSYLLKADEHQLHIDQLIPKNGNPLLQSEQPLDIRISHKGIAYSFRSNHISQSVDEAGFPYHQISLPAQIQYLEQRSSYRIHIKLAERPTAHVSVANEKPCPAQLENISESGAYLRLQSGHPPFEVNDLIGFEICLAGLDPLKCQAVVRHHRYLAKTHETKIGIEFWQLPASTAKKLHKALMKMQRHNLRTHLTT